VADWIYHASCWDKQIADGGDHSRATCEAGEDDVMKFPNSTPHAVEQLKHDFLTAFAAANPNSEMPWLQYSSGWWQIGYGPNPRLRRLRNTELAAMIDRLRKQMQSRALTIPEQRIEATDRLCKAARYLALLASRPGPRGADWIAARAELNAAIAAFDILENLPGDAAMSEKTAGEEIVDLIESRTTSLLKKKPRR
jgi:hypothetical protein